MESQLFASSTCRGGSPCDVTAIAQHSSHSASACGAQGPPVPPLHLKSLTSTPPVSTRLACAGSAVADAPPLHQPLQLSESDSSLYPDVAETLKDRLGSTACASPSHPADVSGVRFKNRRGVTGPMRSVEVVGNSLVAFGRTVLTDVSADVTAGAGKDHEGPAAADTPGIFMGVKNFNSSSRHVFTLGTLRGVRFLSCFRFKLWWMTQRVGTSGREVPYETQFLLLECAPLPRAKDGAAGPAQESGAGRRLRVSNQAVAASDPVFVVVLPVLEGAFRSSLQGGLKDQLDVCVESGDPSVTTCIASEAVYVHAGRNPFRTISEAVRAVEAHSDSFSRREMKTLPGLLDHFGWCTWDAFYTDVTAHGVNEGLESLAAGGTPAKFLIIDDGWQTVVDDMEMEKPRGKITAGTQYASRLACVKENQKFKSSSSFKRKEAPYAAPKEASPPATQENGAAGKQNGTAAPATQENGAEAEEGGIPNGHSIAQEQGEGNGAVAEMGALQAAAASLAMEEDRLAGLGELVKQVKASHAVKFVYVWHALLGYWGGVKPGPQGGMERFDPLLTFPVPSHGVLANQPDMAEDTLTLNGLGVVAPHKAFTFYDELHGYLASCGVDGVKVDVQSILETVGAGHGGRVALARSYHAALESSIRKNFRDNGIISCMSHNTDALYLAKQTAVMRASDDFWPTDPASHTVHIISVAYNSLFLGEFMQPDWDMFQSLHPAAEFHGAARAAGGCAVYVSDKPNRHDFTVLRKLVFPDGSILRARLPGRPTRDSLFVDPARDAKSLLKIWNLNHCNGIVAAFNCQGAAWCRENRKYAVHNRQPGAVTGVVSVEDVDALVNVAPADWDGDVVVYSHFADELVPLSYQTNLVVSLNPLQCEVYTMAPIKVLGAVQFAPVGFGRMYNAGGAVLDAKYTVGHEQSPQKEAEEQGGCSNGARASATLRVQGGGELLLFSSARPAQVLVEGAASAFEYSYGDGRVSVELSFSPSPRDVVVSY